MGNVVFSFQTANLIIFGRNKYKDLGNLIKERNIRNVAIISDKVILKTGIIDEVICLLKSESIYFDIYCNIVPEVPIKAIEAAITYFKDKQIELIIGIGGGSCIDTAKILSLILRQKGKVEEYIGIDRIQGPVLPTIMMPTTAGTGAEVTPNAIITNTNIKLKQAIVSRYLLPDIAIIDPSFTDTVPSEITAYTGMDAFTHALESFVSNNASPLTDILAKDAMGLIANNLESAVKDGDNKKARDNLALGSMFGGMALTGAGTGGVHALAYPLGGEFNIPHGLANTIMLKYVVDFNIPVAVEKFSNISNIIEGSYDRRNQKKNAKRIYELIEELIKNVNIDYRLRDFGITNKDIHRLAKSAIKIKRLIDNNPRKMTVSDIEDIYRLAM